MSDLFSTPEFWILVAFIMIVAVVIRPLRRAVTKALDERGERIKSQLDEAQRLREEAQHLLAEYQRKQRQAHRDAEQILTRARAEADRHRTQHAEELEAALKRREQQAMDRIAQAESDALDEVRQRAADIAVAATRQLLKEKVEGAKGDALIDAAIEELPERMH